VRPQRPDLLYLLHASVWVRVRSGTCGGLGGVHLDGGLDWSLVHSAQFQWPICLRRAYEMRSCQAGRTNDLPSRSCCSHALYVRSNGCGRLTDNRCGPLIALLESRKCVSVANWLLRRVVSAPLVTNRGCFATSNLAGSSL